MKKFILLVILSVSLLGCAPADLSQSSSLWKPIILDGNEWRHYQIIYVESMPCLVMDSTYPSMTCDWSKWEGN